MRIHFFISKMLCNGLFLPRYHPSKEEEWRESAKQGNSKKAIYLCFIDYVKPFDCIDQTNCRNFLKRWEYQNTLPVFWESCMRVKRQQSEPGVEQQTVSKLGKEYIKAVYCHHAYLTSIQSTSCEMLGWLKHKLESRMWEKYQQPQIYHSNCRKRRGNKEPLDESQRGE